MGRHLADWTERRDRKRRSMEEHGGTWSMPVNAHRRRSGGYCTFSVQPSVGMREPRQQRGTSCCIFARSPHLWISAIHGATWANKWAYENNELGTHSSNNGSRGISWPRYGSLPARREREVVFDSDKMRGHGEASTRAVHPYPSHSTLLGAISPAANSSFASEPEPGSFFSVSHYCVYTNGKGSDWNHGEEAAVLVVVRYPKTPTICDNGGSLRVYFLSIVQPWPKVMSVSCSGYLLHTAEPWSAWFVGASCGRGVKVPTGPWPARDMCWDLGRPTVPEAQVCWLEDV